MRKNFLLSQYHESLGIPIWHILPSAYQIILWKRLLFNCYSYVTLKKHHESLEFPSWIIAKSIFCHLLTKILWEKVLRSGCKSFTVIKCQSSAFWSKLTKNVCCCSDKCLWSRSENKLGWNNFSVNIFTFVHLRFFWTFYMFLQ